MSTSPSTVRLRYLGEHPVSFLHHGIGEVEKDGEFEVPAEVAESFTRRADVEFATRGQKAKAVKAEAEAEEPAAPEA